VYLTKAHSGAISNGVDIDVNLRPHNGGGKLKNCEEGGDRQSVYAKFERQPARGALLKGIS
jgi:hypothetical protein